MLRNYGKWTEARYRSFIISALRRAWMRWPPRNEVKKQARVGRGRYRCNECKRSVPVTVKNEKGKRVNNVTVDHKLPVVDPVKGFESWDTYIERMFVEAEGLQVLCSECHNTKTKAEREIKKKAKK